MNSLFKIAARLIVGLTTLISTGLGNQAKAIVRATIASPNSIVSAYGPYRLGDIEVPENYLDIEAILRHFSIPRETRIPAQVCPSSGLPATDSLVPVGGPHGGVAYHRYGVPHPRGCGMQSHPRSIMPEEDTSPLESIASADVTATKTPPKPLSIGDARFDPTKLRMSQHFAAGAVEKVITTVPVRKPDRFSYIRVHPDPAFHLPTPMLELKEERESYLVHESLRDELAADLVPKIIFPTITRQGVLFLWPVRLPDESDKLDNWNRSALTAAQMAVEGWVRIASNLPLGAYDLFKPTSVIPEPKWPNLDLQQMLAIAFRHHFIDSLDHPRLRAIRGEL